MAAYDDILNSLDPTIRQRIQADFDRYAPMLALFAAWKEGVDDHVSQIETDVIERLAQRIFPQGSWRFPAQALAVPNQITKRELNEETEFTDRITQRRWSPCGPGWMLPTRLGSSPGIEQEGWERYAFVFSIEMDNPKPDARLLTPPMPPEDPTGQQQLVFVGAAEPIVAALAAAPWAIQYPGQPFRPIGVSRYTGYLDFERGLGAARLKQLQLENWLPPFYPYSRKFLRFYLPAPAAAPPGEAWDWLGSGAGIRVAALVSETTADSIRARGDKDLIILNAVPVAQMRTLGEPLLENPDRVGDSYRIPFRGVNACFAASLRESLLTGDGSRPAYHPAVLRSITSEDMRNRPGFEDVDVECDSTAVRPSSSCRVRIYYDSFGEDAGTPSALFRPGGLSYSIPFPPFGALDAPIANLEDNGAKISWYRTLLRAPVLTEGDVMEMLSQLPDCRKHLDLDLLSVQLDIDPASATHRSEWDTYLWPTIISEGGLLAHRATYLTKSMTQNRTAIMPLMRLVFPRGSRQLPDFLMDDLLQYAASVVSMHFMIGWYRVTAGWSEMP
jgi:hypothetical protein